MSRVPDLLVEQLVLGELPEAQAQSVRARLAADNDPRLERLEASNTDILDCLLYTSPSPRDRQKSRMPSSA